MPKEFVCRAVCFLEMKLGVRHVELASLARNRQVTNTHSCSLLSRLSVFEFPIFSVTLVCPCSD